MTHGITLISFTINDWFYWGEHFYSKSAPTPVAEKQPDLGNIPAIQRRRLPLVAKRINQFALAANSAETPIIYVSQQGELSQTLAIIRSFVGEVSPMKFSLSVHNAIAGLLSVAHKNTQSYQAIDSLSGGIETAIIEAYCLLSQHDSVSIVYFDEDLPQEFSALYDEAETPTETPKATVLALTIAKGEDLHLEKQVSEAQDYALKTDYLAVANIADFLQSPAQDALDNRYNACTWRWERRHG